MPTRYIFPFLYFFQEPFFPLSEILALKLAISSPEKEEKRGFLSSSSTQTAALKTKCYCRRTPLPPTPIASIVPYRQREGRIFKWCFLFLCCREEMNLSGQVEALPSDYCCFKTFSYIYFGLRNATYQLDL